MDAGSWDKTNFILAVAKDTTQTREKIFHARQYCRGGETAAENLRPLIDRRPVPPLPIRIPPLGIITRQSTDTLTIDDPDLVQAIGSLREPAMEPVHVDDVLRRVPMSRRSHEPSESHSLRSVD